MPDKTKPKSKEEEEELVIQIASYNTALQGNDECLPQDLVDWLAPALVVSSFLSGGSSSGGGERGREGRRGDGKGERWERGRRAPDIVAVGFQELLPLHLGLTGLSKQVIRSRDELIRSQIETHFSSARLKDNSNFNPDSNNNNNDDEEEKCRYTLVARVVNVGVALLVYARDEEIGTRVRDVQTQWTGCGPGWMGNKGAVGVRFRIEGIGEGDVGETFTFVNAHLTAHPGNLQYRIGDYEHIVRTLLFESPSTAKSTDKSTIYDTSHLFFLGDLNFRLALSPSPSSPFSSLANPANRAKLLEALDDEQERESLKDWDELYQVMRKGKAFVGMHEGEFWRFKCTYKYKLGEVDRYSPKRMPAWTDRVLYASYLDSQAQEDAPDGYGSSPTSTSSIKNVLYTSIPSYTTSDHKPIVSLLLVPTRAFSSSPSSSSSLSKPTQPPILTSTLPTSLTSTLPHPDPYATLKRYTGRTLDRLVGGLWTLFWVLGLGNAAGGVFNFLITVAAWRWMTGKWSWSPSPGLELRVEEA